MVSALESALEARTTECNGLEPRTTEEVRRDPRNRIIASERVAPIRIMRIFMEI
jgi:hypothetical protein